MCRDCDVNNDGGLWDNFRFKCHLRNIIYEIKANVKLISHPSHISGCPTCVPVCRFFPLCIIYNPRLSYQTWILKIVLLLEIIVEIQTYRDKAGRCVCPCRRQRSWAGTVQVPLPPTDTSVESWGSVSAGRGNDLLSVGTQGQSFKANSHLKGPLSWVDTNVY